MKKRRGAWGTPPLGFLPPSRASGTATRGGGDSQAVFTCAAGLSSLAPALSMRMP